MPDKKKCVRCGTPRTDKIDSDICGSCADDLRMEQEGDDWSDPDPFMPIPGIDF